jgi:hypothetical protein
MQTRVDERFRDEVRRFSLRFACEDCAHFDAREAACSFGYPAAPRRQDLQRTSLELCKEFELV